MVNFGIFWVVFASVLSAANVHVPMRSGATIATMTIEVLSRLLPAARQACDTSLSLISSCRCAFPNSDIGSSSPVQRLCILTQLPRENFRFQFDLCAFRSAFPLRPLPINRLIGDKPFHGFEASAVRPIMFPLIERAGSDPGAARHPAPTAQRKQSRQTPASPRFDVSIPHSYQRSRWF